MVMFQEAIPVAQYEQLVDQFHPDRFDADFITDLALEAGMKYITVTTGTTTASASSIRKSPPTTASNRPPPRSDR